MSSYAPACEDEPEALPAHRGNACRAGDSFSFVAANADADAFAALMRHLARCMRRRTVIMVQVENEIG